MITNKTVLTFLEFIFGTKEDQQPRCKHDVLDYKENGECEMARGNNSKDHVSLIPEYFVRIKNDIPAIKQIHNSVIQTLWYDFSDTWYGNYCVVVDELNIEAFRYYLFSDRES